MEARPLLINTAETDEAKLLRDAASASTKFTRIWIVVIFSILSLLQVYQSNHHPPSHRVHDPMEGNNLE